MDYTRKMLTEIRKRMSEQNITDLPRVEKLNESDNMLRRFNILMEEAEVDLKKKSVKDNEPDEKAFIVKASDVQFGSVRSSQEDAIRKTIGDVKLKDDAMKYYPEIQDLVINGEVTGLGITFQFRYKDPSGEGCYIWCEGVQLTDNNSRTIEKIRDAFLNWKQSLVEDGDLLDKLHKEANKE